MNILTETFESIDPRSNDTRGCDGGVRQELAGRLTLGQGAIPGSSEKLSTAEATGVD
jgi:hypothetical protein